MSAEIPVAVVGGYLGAGKTTLVNHLLRNARGRRLAVLVNDFGALPIDADLIEAEDGGVISIAGGCVCCSYGSDLMAALQTLARRDPPPQQVIIETSGVALPGIVARSAALIAPYRNDAVVVLADAETLRARAADRYVGDTILRQLAEADLVVLNKTDLVAVAQADALCDWLDDVAPGARVVDAVRAEVPAEVLFGVEGDPETRIASRSGMPLGAARSNAGIATGKYRQPGDASACYESLSFGAERPVDLASLASALARPESGLLRAKGVLRDTDGALKTLQLVGTRVEIRAHTAPRASALGLVCIGLRGRLDRAGLASAFAANSANP